MLLIPRLACPYCYETFTARQILFRCHGRPTRGGQPCELRQDEVLNRRWGNRGELGPVFSPDGWAKGRANAATCPRCGGSTNYRICPVCHSHLPVQFGMINSRMIGMAGARDSGKTIYMTVLLHELRNRVGAEYDAAIMGADDDTLGRFTESYEDVLYEEKRMLLATRGAGQNEGRVDPLVFRFTAAQEGPDGGKREQRLMSFFDTAGEDFRSQDSVDVNTRYLASADGILLLLDPLQMPGARRLAAPGTPLPGTGPEYQSPEEILTRITHLLLSQNKGGSPEIRKPIAVAFTKIDALWHTFDEGSPLRITPPSRGRFDTSDSLDVHEQVRHLLRSWDSTQIDQILRQYYPQHRFFGISALGRAPTPDQKVAASGIQPYRVADPLLWLLSGFRAVPKTREGR
jgi:Double-GTPase 2